MWRSFSLLLTVGFAVDVYHLMCLGIHFLRWQNWFLLQLDRMITFRSSYIQCSSIPIVSQSNQFIIFYLRKGRQLTAFSRRLCRNLSLWTSQGSKVEGSNSFLTRRNLHVSKSRFKSSSAPSNLGLTHRKTFDDIINCVNGFVWKRVNQRSAQIADITAVGFTEKKKSL